MKNLYFNLRIGEINFSLSKNKSAFTLVELIIVVTIIAILATIAFLSFSKYPWKARDVERLTDKNNIEKALEIYKSQKWEYPKFDKEDWQKVFWTGAWEKVNNSLATLPRDPLTKKLYKIKINHNWKVEVILDWESKYINWNSNESVNIDPEDTSDENCTIPIRKKWNTIISNKCAAAWQKYNFEWVEYYIAMDKEDIKNKIFNENFQANRIVTSKVTDMEKLFYKAKTFNQDIWNWDTSNVTTMANMFQEAYKFNQPLNDWNTSKVVDTNDMFRNARKFNQPLNNFDMSKVVDMSWMFADAWEFNQDINNWDISSAKSLSAVFAGTKKFNQPLNKWNTSKATDMINMFSNTWEFNQDIWSWDVSKVTNMERMFAWAGKFNQPLNNWKTWEVVNMKNMFSDTWEFNQDISNWNVSKVKNWNKIFDSSVITNEHKPIKFR